MVKNEGAVKEIKKKFGGRISRRSTLVNGLRLETWGKTPAVVSESHKLAILGRPRHLRTHTCKRTLAHWRVLPLVGGQSGYKARRKRDECREERTVGSAETENERGDRRKEKEKEQASGTEKL